MAAMRPFLGTPKAWVIRGARPLSSISQRMLSGRWDPPLMTSAVTSWRVLAGTALGSNHVASGLPNQDAVGSRATDDGAAVVLAVADGHGGARYVRSAEGARLAVEIALELGSPFLERHRSDDPAAFDRALQSELSRCSSTDGRQRSALGRNVTRSRVRPTRSCHTAAHCCAPS